MAGFRFSCFRNLNHEKSSIFAVFYIVNQTGASLLSISEAHLICLPRLFRSYPNGRSPIIPPRKIGTPAPSAADLRNHTASSFPRMEKYSETLRSNRQLSESSPNILSVESIPASCIPDNTSCQMRLSGLQKEALALYRKCLRESRKKPAVCVPRPAHVSSVC